MSTPDRGSSLLRRVLREHRRALIVLILLLLGNVVVYATVVYPLARRVANSEQRDLFAEQALAVARADHAQASGTLTGKDRASAELAIFYRDVLPTDLASARRLTHLRLPQLALQANLRYERGGWEPVAERGSTLTRLKIELSLSGRYADVRTFIHELEVAPEFVVVDNIELSEDGGGEGALIVTLELSTYYREGTR